LKAAILDLRPSTRRTLLTRAPATPAPRSSYFRSPAAQGWLGYATASCPAGTTLTFMDAYWPVGATPARSQSFYSPWFGIDASDNLNLLQPVNPWLGNEWQIYNEYFQWSECPDTDTALTARAHMRLPLHTPKRTLP